MSATLVVVVGGGGGNGDGGDSFFCVFLFLVDNCCSGRLLACFLVLINVHSNVRPLVQCAAPPIHEEQKCRQPQRAPLDNGRVGHRAARQQIRCVYLGPRRQRAKKHLSPADHAVCLARWLFCPNRFSTPTTKKQKKESVALEEVSHAFATSNSQHEDFGSYALIVDANTIDQDMREGLLAPGL